MKLSIECQAKLLIINNLELNFNFNTEKKSGHREHRVHGDIFIQSLCTLCSLWLKLFERLSYGAAVNDHDLAVHEAVAVAAKKRGVFGELRRLARAAF